MRQRNIQGRALRRAPQQIDLFTPAGVGTPGWIDLPLETRVALTRLMTRLILEHRQGDQALLDEEVRYDR